METSNFNLISFYLNLGGRYIKTRYVAVTLYAVGVLIVIIPIVIVLMTEQGLSAFESHLVLNIAISLILLGKIITLIEKKIAKQRIVTDIGIIIALLILLLFK